MTKLPTTTQWVDLPDVFEQHPPGSLSFHVREDVVVESGIDGSVFYVPEKNQFYVQSDPVGSSTLTYFGPIHGHPRDHLKPWR